MTKVITVKSANGEDASVIAEDADVANAILTLIKTVVKKSPKGSARVTVE